MANLFHSPQLKLLHFPVVWSRYKVSGQLEIIDKYCLWFNPINRLMAISIDRNWALNEGWLPCDTLILDHLSTLTYIKAQPCNKAINLYKPDKHGMEGSICPSQSDMPHVCCNYVHVNSLKETTANVTVLVQFRPLRWVHRIISVVHRLLRDQTFKNACYKKSMSHSLLLLL